MIVCLFWKTVPTDFTLGFVKTIALAMAYCKSDKPTATNQRSRIYCLETSYGAGFLDLPDYTGTSPPKI